MLQHRCLAILAVWCLLGAYLNYVLTQGVSDDPNEPRCYKVERKFCPTDGNFCSLNGSKEIAIKMYCCNLTSEKQIEDFLRSSTTEYHTRPITGLHIRDSNFSVLNLNFFDRMKELTSLSITDSRILRVGKNFEENHPLLACLEISNNFLPEFSNLSLLTKLTGLKKVVVANNLNMTSLPHLPQTRTNIELDVSGNQFLECKFLVNITEFVFYRKMQINQLNKNDTICLPPARYFNNPYTVTMRQIDQVKEIFRNCPAGEEMNCSCEVFSLEGLPDNDIAYHAIVNCSGRRLTSLPKILPPFTRILDLSHNSITSLEGINNMTYGDLAALFADFNNITSLRPLEGTKFLENFQNLSLTNNYIDDIPLHILTNVFDRSYSLGKKVLLAKNVLKCECDTAAVTKNWLIRMSDSVPDYKEVLTMCDDVEIRVIDMNPKDICPTNQLKHYLKYVIIAEITLFVLLVAKVSYDYYVFKTAGYLPWPASKMPKLPCDWCFET